MVVKTITVTEDAYESLKALKEKNESFSEAIRRIAKRKSIWDFVGALSAESGARLEHAIRERRQVHVKSRERRMRRLVSQMAGQHGSS